MSPPLMPSQATRSPSPPPTTTITAAIDGHHLQDQTREPPPQQTVGCPSVPIGLRVYASCSQGGRKYMEDNYDLKYQFNADNELQYIYLAIFDGHGGDVAAKYAKQWLCHNIIRQRGFWSRADDQILRAIHKGFIQTHYDMRKEVLNWPKTASGLPSTSGTTASIVFIMNGKYYTGHVGDSRIVLGRKHEASGKWMSCSLTRDHKPESPREKRRIEAAGGQVMNKSGVDRVVWNRPKLGHKGPVRRSTSFDQIPFLAVARSLGDLWSFNSENNTFIVSPEPDLKCIPIDANDMCLMLASDGLWNMMTTQTAVKVLQEVEEDQYSPELLEAIFDAGTARLSPSRALVHFCLNRWYQSRFRADNTTVVAVMIEDNQGVELMRNNQNLPMNALFSDSEEDESDDGYDDSLDGVDFFSNFYNTKNNENKELDDKKAAISSSEVSSTTATAVNMTTTVSTVPQTIDSSNSTELSQNSLICPQNGDYNDAIVLTPLVNSPPNLQTIDNNNSVLESIENDCNSKGVQTLQSDMSADNEVTAKSVSDSIDDNDNQSNESSRDSGTASPPTPTVISAMEELSEEEYASLPSLVNLSQNEWELHVVIDPMHLSVNSTDFNTVSIGGEENSCLMEGQSSLANLNKVIEENTSLNNYIYSKTGFLRNHHHHNHHIPKTSHSIMNGSDLLMNATDNYWSESGSGYYHQLTALKPMRTSLPLSLVDNHSPVLSAANGAAANGNYGSPLISLHDKNSTVIEANNLCLFGALKSCAMNPNSSPNGNNSSDNSLQKLSKVFSQSNNNTNNYDVTSDGTISGDNRPKKRSIFRHSRLLRRITMDMNGAAKHMRTPLLAKSGVKRKYSPSSASDYSPPSKHLRSSLWTRPLVSKEHLMRMNFTRSLKQLAVGRLTRSRLRPIKLLKAFAKK